MRIYVDLQAAQAGPALPSSRYALELALALEREAPGRIDGYLLNPEWPVPASLEPLHRTLRLFYVDRIEPDTTALHHTILPLPRGARLDHIGQARRVCVSVVAVRTPDSDSAGSGTLENALERELVRSADRIVAASPSLAAAVAAEAGIPTRRITTIRPGAGPEFWPAPDRVSLLDELRLRHPWLAPGFVLASVGSDHAAALVLLEGYAGLPVEVRRTHQLVVPGRFDRGARSLLERVRCRADLLGQVFLPGNPTRREWVDLCRACELFVFVRLHDEAPLALLEALASGARSIASENGSTADLLPASALFVNRPEGVASMLVSALDGSHGDAPALGDRSWRAPIERLLRIWDETSTALPPARTSRRARIAVVTPLPPQRTGVASYSAELLSCMREHVDIDVFVDVDPATVAIPSGVAAYRAVAFERVERAQGGYDGLLCCLGNNPFHWSAFSILRRYRATVLAHDVRLAWLYFLSESAAAGRVEVLEELMQAVYGADVERLRTRSTFTGYEVDQYGIYMARETIALSSRYLVHSNHAAQLARLDAAPGDDAKVQVVPFGHPLRPAVEQRSEGERVVASFGFPSKAKQSDKLISTFGLVAPRIPDAEFAIVGSLGEDTEEVVTATTAAAGLGDRIRITGWIPDGEYRRWLQRTTVAVQLREYTNGESSAAIADCLAAGVPTIVSDAGASAELPSSAVVKVPRDISSAALGDELLALLADRRRRESLTRGALEYARQNSFAAAAEAIVDAVLSTGTGRRPSAPTPYLSVREGYEPPIEGPGARAAEAGVNLVGPFTARSDFGKQARQLARAFALAGVPHVCVTHHASVQQGGVPFRDDGWPAARHDVNVVCLDQRMLGPIVAAAPQFFAGRLTVVVALEPPCEPLPEAVDEVWTGAASGAETWRSQGIPAFALPEPAGDEALSSFVSQRLASLWSAYVEGTNSTRSNRTPSSR